MKKKWHIVDKFAANELTTATNSPEIILPVPNDKLPGQIKTMTGVSSYYISGYTNPQSHSQPETVAGELLVARSDRGITKNYNYVFAVSSGGKVYFQGPYKGDGHHIKELDPVEINSLFGQTPYSKKGME